MMNIRLPSTLPQTAGTARHLGHLLETHRTARQKGVVCEPLGQMVSAAAAAQESLWAQTISRGQGLEYVEGEEE